MVILFVDSCDCSRDLSLVLVSDQHTHFSPLIPSRLKDVMVRDKHRLKLRTKWFGIDNERRATGTIDLAIVVGE